MIQEHYICFGAADPTGGGAQAVMENWGVSENADEALLPSPPLTYLLLCGPVPKSPHTATGQWPGACVCGFSVASVMSDFLQPHGLQPSRLPLSMGFSRQEHRRGLPCPPPGDHSDPGIKNLESPPLQADSLPLSHWASPNLGVGDP